jgi:hypothetical protein
MDDKAMSSSTSEKVRLTPDGSRKFTEWRKVSQNAHCSSAVNSGGEKTEFLSRALERRKRGAVSTSGHYDEEKASGVGCAPSYLGFFLIVVLLAASTPQSQSNTRSMGNMSVVEYMPSFKCTGMSCG